MRAQEEPQKYLPHTSKQIQEIKHGTKSLQVRLPLLGYLSDDIFA